MEKRAIYQVLDKNFSLRQGEILTGVLQYNPVMDELPQNLQESQKLSFTPVLHPYLLIVMKDSIS
jgi:hypothetical protein